MPKNWKTAATALITPARMSMSEKRYIFFSSSRIIIVKKAMATACIWVMSPICLSYTPKKDVSGVTENMVDNTSASANSSRETEIGDLSLSSLSLSLSSQREGMPKIIHAQAKTADLLM